MNSTNNIATDLFYKIRSRFSGLKLGTSEGTVTILPEEARFFDFDYADNNQIIGHVSISLAEENSIKVYFSTGITESMDTGQKDNWYKFLGELRNFAKRRLMSFDTRDIAKDNLDKRDYMFLSQNNKSQTQVTGPVGESMMNESSLYGTKTVSYQKLLDTRLIIKHSNALVDDTQPGARTRNISALFVENQEGERFKYPFIHLAGARAMQRHVANGGLPYDGIGKNIISMSEEIAKLRSFSNYVVRNDLMNSDNNDLIMRGQDRLNSLKEQMIKLSKQKHYEAFKESFKEQPSIEIPQEVIEQFTDQFTVKNFKEDIKSVFPILYKLKQESELGYDDIVGTLAVKEDEINDSKEKSFIENEFDNLENWIYSLGEESAISSGDEEEKNLAVKKLQDLVGQHFPAGVGGKNAISSLKGIIEDPDLYKQIAEKSKEDPDTCVRPLVKQWLETNAPDVVEKLDFGDMTEEPAKEGMSDVDSELAQLIKSDDPFNSIYDALRRDDAIGQQLQDMYNDIAINNRLHPDDDFESIIEIMIDHLENDYSESNEHQEDSKSKIPNLQELAEFIHSFYDKQSGTFPKGPEGVAIMVGKKFGEQAEHVARKFVERMAPQQTTDQNPELQELSRIKQLAGY